MTQKKSSESLPILVVDDDKDLLKSMEFILLSNEITNVECCEDGREVISLLERKRYSLILLDLVWPHISGEELLQEIVEKYPEIPVIIITAYQDIRTALNCMKNGACDCLLKPFENNQLVKIVRRTLDKIKGRKVNFRLQEPFLSNILENPEAFWEIINDIREMQNFYILKIAEIFLQMGKSNLVVNNIGRLLENEKTNEYNIDLFYALGEAYEKSEEFMKADGLYKDIVKFDPQYTGIQQKLDKIEKLKQDIIQIYHKERYEILEKIGGGGMGVVYKAKDINLERMVALKILNKNSITDDNVIEWFISEAKRVAKLHHANIVGVYDSGKLENDYFISMEFIEGIDLDTIIDDKHPIPLPDILVIAKKLFMALAHSHQEGVVHRDVKPQNIMIAQDNEVKVVDFGIAVLKEDLKKDISRAIIGTPFYMSPEQIKGASKDHLTDIYSAGVTLFHLACGRVPYEGTIEQIFYKHLFEPVPPIEEYRSDTPVGLIQIIEKCMEKNKEDRYQSAEVVIEAIDGVRDNKGKTLITNKTKLKIFDIKKSEEELQASKNSKKSEAPNITVPMKLSEEMIDS